MEQVFLFGVDFEEFKIYINSKDEASSDDLFNHWRNILYMLYNPMHIEEDAVKAIDSQYQHGGGWHDIKGKIRKDERLEFIKYPLISPDVKIKRLDETIYFYPGAYVGVIDNNNKQRISRID